MKTLLSRYLHNGSHNSEQSEIETNSESFIIITHIVTVNWSKGSLGELSGWIWYSCYYACASRCTEAHRAYKPWNHIRIGIRPRPPPPPPPSSPIRLGISLSLSRLFPTGPAKWYHKQVNRLPAGIDQSNICHRSRLPRERKHMNVAKAFTLAYTLMHECRVNVSVACLAVTKSLFGRASTSRFDRNYDRYARWISQTRLYLTETIVYGGVLRRGEPYSCVPLNAPALPDFYEPLAKLTFDAPPSACSSSMVSA